MGMSAVVPEVRKESNVIGNECLNEVGILVKLYTNHHRGYRLGRAVSIYTNHDITIPLLTQIIS